MKKTVNSSEFKAKVAFEAAKGQATINEIATKYKIYPAQVSQWKKELLENLSSLFQKGGKMKDENREAQEAVLYEQIGRLKVEVDWLKKNLKRYSSSDRRYADNAAFLAFAAQPSTKNPKSLRKSESAILS